MPRKSSNPQLQMIPKVKSNYGGDLLTKRKAREIGRPLSTRRSMHLVVKSSLATGAWAFNRNRKLVRSVTDRLSVRYGIKVLQLGIVSNHLHLHIKFGNREAFKAFIRVWTAALVMQITKVSRTHRPEALKARSFWDRRPWTRIVGTFNELRTLMAYIARNALEGIGVNRQELDRSFALMSVGERARLVRYVFG
jgi:REP element-mobilizing transposase RayT